MEEFLVVLQYVALFEGKISQREPGKQSPGGPSQVSLPDRGIPIKKASDTSFRNQQLPGTDQHLDSFFPAGNRRINGTRKPDHIKTPGREIQPGNVLDNTLDLHIIFPGTDHRPVDHLFDKIDSGHMETGLGKKNGFAPSAKAQQQQIASL